MAHEQTRPVPLTALTGAMFACSAIMAAFAALLAPLARLLEIAPWSVGVAVAAGGLAWMLAAPFWGGLADRRGRRWTLLAGLAGFAVAFAGLCLFLQAALIWALAPPLVLAALFLGRVFGGLFYAAAPIASTALIADHLAPGQRTAALATMAAGSGAGLFVGPAAAALLAAIDLTLPLLLMAIVPFAVLALVWGTLPRTEIHARSTASRLHIGDRRLRTPLAIALLSMCCIGVAQFVVGFYALDRLGLSPAAAAVAAGAALACVGAAMIAAQMLVRALAWAPHRFICLGAALGSAGLWLVLSAETSELFCIAHALAALGLGFILPAVQAMAADAVAAHEQGSAAGAISAAHGLALTIGPLAGAMLYQLDARAPYALMATLLAIMALCLWRPFPRIARAGR